MKDVKRQLLILVGALSAGILHAQNLPVGIVSIQDTMRSVQLGIFSSVATDDVSGLQLSSMSNISAAPLHGLQFSGHVTTWEMMRTQ